MNRFTIESELSWYTNPTTHKRQRGLFLNTATNGFYHTDYVSYERRNEITNYPFYLLTLKNDPTHNWAIDKLQNAQRELSDVLLKDLPNILKEIQLNQLTICVVPRSKADTFYRPDQLFFKVTVKEVVEQLRSSFQDGTNFIVRHSNTKTTHLRRPIEGYENDGSEPYPGISLDTCYFSNEIKGRNILLIDDIYTYSVNIDEDMIQALLKSGASSVTFYSIGKTK